MWLPSLHRLWLLPRTGMAPADEAPGVAEQAPDASANDPPPWLVSFDIHRSRNEEVAAQSNRLARLALQDEDAFRHLLRSHLLPTRFGTQAVYVMLATCLADGQMRPAVMTLRILWEEHVRFALYHRYARIVGALLRSLVVVQQQKTDQGKAMALIAQFIDGMRFWYTSPEMAHRSTRLVRDETLEAQLMSKDVLVAFAASILQTDAQRDALRSHPLMA